MYLCYDLRPIWQLEWTTLKSTQVSIKMLPLLKVNFEAKLEPTPTVIILHPHTKPVEQLMHGINSSPGYRPNHTVILRNKLATIGFQNKFHAHPLNQPNPCTVSERQPITCNLYPSRIVHQGCRQESLLHFSGGPRGFHGNTLKSWMWIFLAT